MLTDLLCLTQVDLLGLSDLVVEDRALAVEQIEYFVALLNVNLAASDRDDLTPAQFLALNELLKLATICNLICENY